MCPTSTSTSLICGHTKSTWESKWDMLFVENCKEWISFSPSIGATVYPCYSCQNLFSSKSSLLDHVNRRTILLKYHCTYCNENLNFYNRCSFLLHARTHFVIEFGEINLSHLDVLPLPLGLAGFLPRLDIPVLFNEEPNVLSENVYIHTQFYYPELSERGKQIVHLKCKEIYFSLNANNEYTLAIRQISANIPKCLFITINEHKQIKERYMESIIQEAEKIQIKEEPNFTIPIISKIESLNESVISLKRVSENIHENGNSKKINSIVNTQKCLECGDIQTNVIEHFQGSGLPNNDFKCLVCNYKAASKCSLSAHIRIHKYEPPYICPECGRNFEDYNDIHVHMDRICFHLAKSVRFRCPGIKCGKLFALTQTYAAHFEVHMQILYQGNLCKTIFLRESEFDQHSCYNSGMCHLNKLFKCNVCVTMVTRFNEIEAKQHIQWHIKDRKRLLYVYLCKLCRNCFRSKVTYESHTQKCSKWINSSQEFKKIENIKYINSNCPMCDTVVLTKANEPNTLCSKCKVLKQNVIKCGTCKQEILYTQGNLPPHCTKCNSTALLKGSGSKQQKSYETENNSKKYNCLLCNTELYNCEKNMHVKNCKYANPTVMMEQLDINSTENPSVISEEDEASPLLIPKLKRRQSESSEDLKKKRKKSSNGVKNKRNDSNGSDIEFELQPENSIVVNGVYKCRLCYHIETDRSQFHYHILKHRDVKTSYQCMECGECFVVKPSLIKHLLHYHHIANPEEYFKGNNCYNEKAVRELADTMKLAPGASKNVKKNQCCVCQKQFDNETSLNKHFRIHGMAFLMMKSQ